MKKIITILFVLFLTGCQSDQIIISKKIEIIHPDKKMYYCPVIKQLPNWKTLKDSQVATTTASLYKNNLTCKKSIESIRKYNKIIEDRIKKGG